MKIHDDGIMSSLSSPDNANDFVGMDTRMDMNNFSGRATEWESGSDREKEEEEDEMSPEGFVLDDIFLFYLLEHSIFFSFFGFILRYIDNSIMSNPIFLTFSPFFSL